MRQVRTWLGTFIAFISKLEYWQNPVWRELIFGIAWDPNRNTLYFLQKHLSFCHLTSFCATGGILCPLWFEDFTWTFRLGETSVPMWSGGFDNFIKIFRLGLTVPHQKFLGLTARSDGFDYFIKSFRLGLTARSDGVPPWSLRAPTSAAAAPVGSRVHRHPAPCPGRVWQVLQSWDTRGVVAVVLVAAVVFPVIAWRNFHFHLHLCLSNSLMFTLKARNEKLFPWSQV